MSPQPLESENTPSTVESETRSNQPENDDEVCKERSDEAESEEEGLVRQDEDAKHHQDSEPPLPQEVPPLPNEAPPSEAEDDGWQPVWDDSAQAFYFFNHFTRVTQWENPRVQPAQTTAPGVGNYDRLSSTPESSQLQDKKRPHGGYNPAIHGDYDPNADYAKEDNEEDQGGPSRVSDSSIPYAATGTFNRFTGKWQQADITPENYNDENKSKRQMNAYFDVDAAANSHDGKSLKAERAGKKLTKKELKAFKEKRREKKEEKRRAWLRD
ncbi:MAG: hypothetical protein M1834_004459 [Cirrosporium novae-zelandiae]|nr:MAG: hypothetical protein M1834_004459 [Cirrosporium novae-zelandiae]